MVPLKYLSNFWRTLEMPLINCEISLMTLSTQDNVKLLKQLEAGFKRTINWNKHQSKITEQAHNRYLNFLTDPSFQQVNRLFVSLFEDKNVRKSYKRYFLPTAEIKY